MAKKPLGNQITLSNVTLAFPSLDQARPYKMDEGKPDAKLYYSGTFLLDPTDPKHKLAIKNVSSEIKRLIKEAWGERPAKMKDITCFGKGDTQTNDQGEVYKGFEGMYFVAANNMKRPTLRKVTGEVDANNKPVYDDVTPEEAEKLFYGGANVTASINFWVQDNDYGKGIRCSLRGVKFREHGEAFGGANVTDDEFEDDDDLELGSGELDLDDDFDDDDLLGESNDDGLDDFDDFDDDVAF